MDPLLEHIEFVIAGLGIAGLLWIWAHGFYLQNFRKNIKEEQTVGVRFAEDQVLNRKIVRISLDRTSCLVMDSNSKRLIFVPIEQVFAPDPYSSAPSMNAEPF